MFLGRQQHGRVKSYFCLSLSIYNQQNIHNTKWPLPNTPGCRRMPYISTSKGEQTETRRGVICSPYPPISAAELSAPEAYSWYAGLLPPDHRLTGQQQGLRTQPSSHQGTHDCTPHIPPAGAQPLNLTRPKWLCNTDFLPLILPFPFHSNGALDSGDL